MYIYIYVCTDYVYLYIHIYIHIQVSCTCIFSMCNIRIVCAHIYTYTSDFPRSHVSFGEGQNGLGQGLLETPALRAPLMRCLAQRLEVPLRPKYQRGLEN